MIKMLKKAMQNHRNQKESHKLCGKYVLKNSNTSQTDTWTNKGTNQPKPQNTNQIHVDIACGNK